MKFEVWRFPSAPSDGLHPHNAGVAYGMRVFSRLQAMALAAAVYGAALPHLSTLAAPPAGALEIARQLNEAFVDVADRCTPTVVVVQVAQKLESITECSTWDLSATSAGF